MGKRILYGVLIFTILVAGGTMVWLYIGDFPRKTPIRAKQVWHLPVHNILLQGLANMTTA